MSRTKRYTAEDGCYLVIGEWGDVFSIDWYDPKTGDTGLGVGELRLGARCPKRRENADTWLSQKAAKPFADEIEEGKPFVFYTRRKAAKALAAANEALHANVVWPAWALKAKAEGWIPPKGWRP